MPTNQTMQDTMALGNTAIRSAIQVAHTILETVGHNAPALHAPAPTAADPIGKVGLASPLGDSSKSPDTTKTAMKDGGGVGDTLKAHENTPKSDDQKAPMSGTTEGERQEKPKLKAMNRLDYVGYHTLMTYVPKAYHDAFKKLDAVVLDPNKPEDTQVDVPEMDVKEIANVQQGIGTAYVVLLSIQRA